MKKTNRIGVGFLKIRRQKLFKASFLVALLILSGRNAAVPIQRSCRRLELVKKTPCFHIFDGMRNKTCDLFHHIHYKLHDVFCTK